MSKQHGVPPVNILPDSSSAFVNFQTYEGADKARHMLQGKTVAGVGPLKINPSDYMQLYEEEMRSAGGALLSHANKTKPQGLQNTAGLPALAAAW